MSITVNQLAIDAHTQNMIETGAEQERNRWTQAIRNMLNDLPHSHPIKYDKWCNTKAYAKRETLEDLFFEVTGEEYKPDDELAG